MHHIANDVCEKMTFKNPLYRIIMKINLVKCELVLCEDALKHRLARHMIISLKLCLPAILSDYTSLSRALTPSLSPRAPFGRWLFNFRKILHRSGNLRRNILPHDNSGNLISAKMYEVKKKSTNTHTDTHRKMYADFDANDSLHVSVRSLFE